MRNERCRLGQYVELVLHNPDEKDVEDGEVFAQTVKDMIATLKEEGQYDFKDEVGKSNSMNASLKLLAYLRAEGYVVTVESTSTVPEISINDL